MGAIRKINPSDVLALAEVIKQASGIHLTPDKSVLLETRLATRLAQLDVPDFASYAKLVNRDAEERRVCVELLTTHKTEWFRERDHFQWLKGHLGNLKGQGLPIKIWSAACSSGPEVYSLMLLLLKELHSHNQFRILGTDISRPILEKAMALPQSKEFKQQVDMLLMRSPDRKRLEHEIDLSLENSIKFREFNLITGALDSNIQFDVIFLRNVLIYFDRPTIHAVCRNLCRYLKPGGHLIIGLTESLHNEVPELQTTGKSIYTYNPRGHE